MNKIYNDAKDKNVSTVIVYGDSDNGYVYTDAKKQNKIAKDVLLDLYFKGMTVSYEGAYLTPVSYKDNTTDACIKVVGDSGNVTFYSAEHDA